MPISLMKYILEGSKSPDREANPPERIGNHRRPQRTAMKTTGSKKEDRCLRVLLL